MKSIDEQIRIIMKGVDDLIDEKELREKLIKSEKEGKPMIVKLGLDPSAPDIHLGHTVVLRKMKQLQDLGHQIVIIIGDFTGKIGDPTGKSKARKALTTEQVLENAKTYEEQIFKVLDKEKTIVRFNSEWLAKLNFEDVIKLAATITVARMLEREDFKKRYEGQMPISVHEFFYPLMQAYDSIALEADIELGGTDQRFNLLMGRSLQREFGMESQIVIMMPLIEGLDGKEKMSKSLGNYIGIDEEAGIMYQKSMEIPDELIIKYYNLVTDVHPDEVNKIETQLKDGSVNPRDIKMNLAREIVTLYHGEEAAKEAEERFKSVFQKGQIPEDIQTIQVKQEEFDLIEVLVSNELVKSKSEVRRLASQGGVKVNGEKVEDLSTVAKESELVVQIGKKKFVKIELVK
ncbi:MULTISPECIES: tyrosine--tRNA ligase [unclassified Clostridioides]|uniref:tyrosine--tRNA ligase n=1 Tax=unclassified Clostridioides TaxID=2635829 RepID=UPI001D0FFE6F|nr:tyrosine--tRNA ligase [Clostridioides sp. ZZV15-6388]MCC0644391.1 tyrosine--tRNA ligase [Clostridioides sp. ZZV14-6150]MCC0659474.1 tyrosine--tRNA ligase [Clostridioides sp. ZZV14-6154]MCC0666172.1 tyrosine--tRNA ligase [Clostridioides sp. ZZV15-6597]MCC0667013.1 tyrosine--tRNA ligase [Clostridioides sp. ZZV14-6153]MCC0718711.1 tyrosine--tRNA ligase [Clostridioides sp. ZZV14-6105]MCC0723213.1 tyrosine--tRNA ligase [Clostridioides sp. ZZV14-6104]MCC0726280.1 tyrosine--tRNA ligase [Clostrid